jgi:hypothetical protein
MEYSKKNACGRNVQPAFAALRTHARLPPTGPLACKKKKPVRQDIEVKELPLRNLARTKLCQTHKFPLCPAADSAGKVRLRRRMAINKRNKIAGGVIKKRITSRAQAIKAGRVGRRRITASQLSGKELKLLKDNLHAGSVLPVGIKRASEKEKLGGKLIQSTENLKTLIAFTKKGAVHKPAHRLRIFFPFSPAHSASPHYPSYFHSGYIVPHGFFVPQAWGLYLGLPPESARERLAHR